MTSRKVRCSALSLMELLIVIAIIGITTLFAVPLFTDIVSRSGKIVAQRDAQHAVTVSSDLSSIGVAHVLPVSLGGVEATTRLLRRGVVVPDGPYKGKVFTVGQMSDESIEAASVYMDILFATTELRLQYVPNPTVN